MSNALYCINNFKMTLNFTNNSPHESSLQCNENEFGLNEQREIYHGLRLPCEYAVFTVDQGTTNPASVFPGFNIPCKRYTIPHPLRAIFFYPKLTNPLLTPWVSWGVYPQGS